MPQIGAAIAAAFTAGTSALSAGLAAGGIQAFVIRTGLSLLLSIAANALTPRARERGVRIGEVETGEDIPLIFPMGRTALPGSRTYRGSHGTVNGTPNSFYTQVFEVSSLPRVSLQRVILDGGVSALGDTAHPDYGFPLLSMRRDGTDYGWIKWYDGTQTTADAGLVSAYSADPDQPWTSAHVGTGIAYAIVTYRLDRERQFPQSVLFEVDGIPVYDPRKDGTVGGSGAHRWNNQATWEFSDNPAVLAYNLLRGVPLPDGGFYGGGVAGADLPLASWFAAMNVCDTLVGDRRQFRAGYAVRVDEEPADVIDKLVQAGLGRVSEVGGVFEARFGAPPAASVSFSDSDISIQHAQNDTPFPGLERTYNGVLVTHPSLALLWQPQATEVATDAAWVAADGDRELTAQVALPAVYDHQQARQIAYALARDNRRFRVHQVVLPPEYGRVKALDTVAWTSPRNGYVNKDFEVLERYTLPGTLVVVLTLREIDPNDYSWNSGDDLPNPPTPVVTPPAPRFLDTADWSVTADAVEDEEGEPRRPALRINWDAARVTDATFIRWQVRVLATQATSSTARGDAGDGVAFVTEGIVPEVEYEVRLRPVIPGRETAWSSWKSVTALDVYFSDRDLAPTLRDRINEAFDRHDAQLGAAKGTVQALHQQVTLLIDRVDELTEASATDTASIQVRSTELSAEFLQSRATFNQQITLLASEDEALAAQITSLSATVGSNTAAISTLEATRVTAAGAVAAVNQEISATYNSVTALATATAFAESTVDGISSGFVWSLGGGDVLSLVQVSDGVTPPVTTARIAAQYIRLDGNVEVTGDFIADNAIFAGSAIQSDNFVSGSTGWQITRAGNAQFNNLIVRGSFAADAVSDRSATTPTGEQNISGIDYATVASISLTGPRNGRNWTIYAHAQIRQQVNAGGPDENTPAPVLTSFRVLRRTRWVSGEDFTAYSVAAALETQGAPWLDVMHSECIDGRFETIEYALQIRAVAYGQFLQNNVRRAFLTAQIPMI